MVVTIEPRHGHAIRVAAVTVIITASAMMLAGWVLELDLPFTPALLAAATGLTLLAASRSLATRIRRSETLYRTIVETSQDGICITDSENRFSFVNGRLAAILGYEPKDLLGRDVHDFIAPEDLPQAMRRDQERRAGAAATRSDLHMVRRDGSLVRLISSATTQRGRDGVVKGAVVMLTDITAHAEAAARESEPRFRTLYEANLVGVAYLSPDGTVSHPNDELMRMVGIPPDGPETWRWTANNTAAADEADRAAMAELNETGRCRPYEKECLRTDGTPFWLLVTAARLGDGTGESIVFAVDITERVESRRTMDRTINILNARLAAFEGLAVASPEADDLSRQRAQIELLASRLAAAHEELEAFSYSVSHDLRAPLRAIEGFSGELLAGDVDRLDERGRHYLTRIVGATKRMGRLIDSLLDLSRMTHKAIRRETVDLSAMAEDILGELPDVRWRVAPGLVAFADPYLVRVVLENLLGNAAKFSSRNAQACIEVFAAGDGVVAVRDNGTGFPMDQAERIFAPFRRLHTSEYEGTGIGLSLVHRIITRHGGAIRAESASGHGATFYFTLGDQPL
jgi:PAS domain S-box-containing protein